MRPGSNSSAPRLGGSGDDTFALGGLTFVSAMRLDGGNGANTLDYSMVTSLFGHGGVFCDLVNGTASGLAGGIARVQKVTGL